MRIKFVVGDHSGDGHDKREELYYEVNLSSGEPLTVEALNKAFKLGCEKLDVDFSQSGKPWGGNYHLNICSEYEDREVPAEFITALEECGLDPYDYFHEYERNKFLAEGVYWGQLWLDVATLGDDRIIYESKNNVDYTFSIDGYGLFV